MESVAPPLAGASATAAGGLSHHPRKRSRPLPFLSGRSIAGWEQLILLYAERVRAAVVDRKGRIMAAAVQGLARRLEAGNQAIARAWEVNRQLAGRAREVAARGETEAARSNEAEAGVLWADLVRELAVQETRAAGDAESCCGEGSQRNGEEGAGEGRESVRAANRCQSYGERKLGC